MYRPTQTQSDYCDIVMYEAVHLNRMLCTVCTTHTRMSYYAAPQSREQLAESRLVNEQLSPIGKVMRHATRSAAEPSCMRCSASRPTSCGVTTDWTAQTDRALSGWHVPTTNRSGGQLAGCRWTDSRPAAITQGRSASGITQGGSASGITQGGQPSVSSQGGSAFRGEGGSKLVVIVQAVGEVAARPARRLPSAAATLHRILPDCSEIRSKTEAQIRRRLTSSHPRPVTQSAARAAIATLSRGSLGGS